MENALNLLVKNSQNQTVIEMTTSDDNLLNMETATSKTS
jgi:hypothetical protein